MLFSEQLVARRFIFFNGYVLSRQTGAVRDCSRDPYGNYVAMPTVWYPLTKRDSTYPAKTVVYASDAEVFPLDNIKSSRTIGGTEVDFVWDSELATVRGHDKGGEEVALTRAYWFCWAGQRYARTPAPCRMVVFYCRICL